MTQDVAELDRLLRLAGNALARHGLVHAYGHCSIRTGEAAFRVSASKPLGLLNASDSGIQVPLEGPLPEGVLGEVRIHREIYRLRPEVRAVVRCMPPKLMSLGTMGRVPRARHGFGSYFHPAPALWGDPQLLRDDGQAHQLAASLGSRPAIVMRGNGAVIVGESLEQAVVLSWYLEDAARIELDCLAAGTAEQGLLTESEARLRATWSGRIVERMWDFMTAGG